MAPLRIVSSRIRPAPATSSTPRADASATKRRLHATTVGREYGKGGGGEAVPPWACKTPPENIAPFASPKVEALFQKIIWLDMIEIHLLTEAINERMGIVISDAERERMARGGGGGAKKKEEEAEEEAKEEKTAFDLKLTGFDAKGKIKVIKEVRGMTTLGLKEAKELVESVPSTVKKDIKKEEAEELKAKLEALGAQVEIV